MEEEQSGPKFEEVFLTSEIKIEPEEFADEEGEECSQEDWQHQNYAYASEQEEGRDVKPVVIPHSALPDPCYTSDPLTGNRAAESVFPMHFLEQVTPERQASSATPLDAIFATSHTLPGTNIVLKRKLVPYLGESSNSMSARVVYLKSPVVFKPAKTPEKKINIERCKTRSNASYREISPAPVAVNTVMGGRVYRSNLLMYTSTFSGPTNVTTSLKAMASVDSLFCTERGHFLNSSKLNSSSRKLLTKLSDSSLKSFDTKIQYTTSTSTASSSFSQPNTKPAETEDSTGMVIKPVNPPSAKNAVTFKCQACRKYFKNHDEACRHIFCHTELRPNVCNKCGTCHKFASALKNHKIKEHLREKKFKCSKCRKIYRKKHALKYHILTYHLKEKHYKCSPCKLEFFKRSHLQEHLSFKHEHSIPYVCTFCSKCVVSLERLTEHTQFQHMKLLIQNNPVVNETESGNVRYFCSNCKILVNNPGNCKNCNSIIDIINDQEFSMHINYIQAIRNKQHGCLVCQEKFTNAYDLKDHMKIEHICNMCDQVYINNYYLFRHLVESVSVGYRRCNFCSDAFVDRRAYKSHLNNHLFAIKKKMEAR